MKFCFVLLLAAVLVPNLHAAEKPFLTGKILDVQQKTTTRVLYYQVDTPITKDEPYYEVSVQVKDTIYVGDYTPRHASATLPYVSHTSGWHRGTIRNRKANGRGACAEQFRAPFSQEVIPGVI
jgi:hypothetical protein